MTSIKDIINKYEVSRATLHNWKTTKPNLYNLLLNLDGKNDELRELTIILEKYSKTINPSFTLEDIFFYFGFNFRRFY